MTNFLGYLNAYLRGNLKGDDGVMAPEQCYVDMPHNNVSKKLESVLQGKYTVTEEIKTYSGFEYTAAMQPTIGISPKRLKKQIRLALKEEGIQANVSVKPGQNELNLKILRIKVQNKEPEHLEG